MTTSTDLKTIVVKDLNGTKFTLTELSEDTKQALEKYGVLTDFNMKEQYLYHLNLNSLNYSTHVPYTKISIVKARRSYGGTQGLWELATVYKHFIRGIMGYVQEEDIEKYIKLVIKESDKEHWFRDLPYEWYRHTTPESAREKQLRIYEKNELL